MGLSLVRPAQYARGRRTVTVDVPTTDDYAISYTASKYGVLEEDVELVRTGSCLRVRVKPGAEEVELMSFEDYLRWVYPIPEPGEAHYSSYNQFGYDVYLINAYPDVFNPTGLSWRDIMRAEMVDYHWYCIEEVSGLSRDVLEQFLLGSLVVALNSELLLAPGLKISVDDLGILLWNEDARAMCLFIVADELVPWYVALENLIISEDIFEGWDEDC